MKKVLAVLAMMFAVLALSFATDDTIQISTIIIGQEPIFTLTTSGASSNTSLAFSSFVPSYDAETPSEQPTAEGQEITLLGNDLLNTPQTVTFTLAQANEARSSRTYTFEVSATDLVNQNPIGDKIADNEKFPVDNTKPELKAAVTPESIVLSKTENDNVIVARYKGYANGQYDPITLATFTLTYGRNSKARGGEYLAQVTLVISGV